MENTQEKQEKPCIPCTYDVTLEVSKKVCELAVNDPEQRKQCQALQEKAIMGETSVVDYLDKIADLVKEDAEASHTIAEIKKFFVERTKNEDQSEVQ